MRNRKVERSESSRDDRVAEPGDLTRRTFVLFTATASAGLTALGCRPKSDDQESRPEPAAGESGGAEKEGEEEISPAEDLMREHGVLNRVLLVYETSLQRLGSGSIDVPPTVLTGGADIIRRFIEDYHEKLEEDHLFPRFEKAGLLTDLVAVLRNQHQAGRRLTDEIRDRAGAAARREDPLREGLTTSLGQFIRMYRPHEAREDTVLFPALRRIVSPHEYGALGEDFEKIEHRLFGEDGFESMVDRVAALERELGIDDLAQFTPGGRQGPPSGR
jgi:hemerythrin-like domain-containing protein